MYFESSVMVISIIITLLIASITISICSVIKDSYQTSKIYNYLDLSHSQKKEYINNKRYQFASKQMIFFHEEQNSLDENRLDYFFDEFYYRSMVVLKYLPTVCVTLGLLGTFIGLSMTMSALAALVTSVNIENASDSMTSFLVELPEAIKGMGVAFHTSLYGIGSSLIAGLYLMMSLKASRCFERQISNKLKKTGLLVHESNEVISSKLLTASLQIEESIQKHDKNTNAAIVSTNKLREGIQSLTEIMSRDVQSALNSVVAETQYLCRALSNENARSIEQSNNI